VSDPKTMTWSDVNQQVAAACGGNGGAARLIMTTTIINKDLTISVPKRNNSVSSKIERVNSRIHKTKLN
jgi:hypothetical protein